MFGALDQSPEVTLREGSSPPTFEVTGSLTNEHTAAFEQALDQALASTAESEQLVLDFGPLAGGDPQVMGAVLLNRSQACSQRLTCRGLPAAVTGFLEMVGMAGFLDLEQPAPSEPGALDASLAELPPEAIEVVVGEVELIGGRKGRARVYLEQEGYCPDIHVQFSPAVASLAEELGCHPCEWDPFKAAVIQLLKGAGKLDEETYYTLSRAELGAQRDDCAVFAGLMTNVARAWCAEQGMRFLD